MDFLTPWTSKTATRRKRRIKTACLLCLAITSAAVDASYAVSTPKHLVPKLSAHHQKRQRDSLNLSSTTSSSATRAARSTSSSSAAIPIRTPDAIDPHGTYPIVHPTEYLPGWTYPLPFDTVLGTNFTSISCPSFFATFLNSASFQACRPLSLLLATSNGFFEAQKNATTILPYVVQETCNVASSCADTMAAYAVKIKQQDVCGRDLAAGNALSLTALNGFLNYPMYYEMGCAKNETTDNYCLTEAEGGGMDSSAMYWWYLGQGTSIPSGSRAACNGCLADLFATSGKFATNKTLQISETYSAARVLANSQCGPDFAPLVDLKSAALPTSILSLHHIYSLILALTLCALF